MLGRLLSLPVKGYEWSWRLTWSTAEVNITWSYISAPPIPIVAGFKAWFAGIACLNLASSMDVCHLWVLCFVKQGSLRQADHSSSGVLLSVVCLSVIVKPRQWRSPGPLRAAKPWQKKSLLHYKCSEREVYCSIGITLLFSITHHLLGKR